ncbi:MAG: peroxiredoxin family protein [Promethearchaeota archaeon]
MLYNKLQELKTEVYIVISNDKERAEKFEGTYVDNKFPIYYDETGKATNPLKQEFYPKRGLMPVVLIVDKYGIIQYAYYGDSSDDFPKNETLIEHIQEIVQQEFQEI